MAVEDPKEIYDEDLDNFPDLSKYLDQLEELKKVGPLNTPFDKLYDKYFDLAVLLPQIITYQDPDNFNTHKLFRVRLNIVESREDCSLIQTYSYPPAFVCTENGRANLKGKSVFYCSNDPSAALLEAKPKPGDIAFMSIWKPVVDRKVKFAHCLPIDLSVSNNWSVMSAGAWQYTANFYTEKAKAKYQHYVALNKFIAERFVNEEKPYYLTSWLANEILFREYWRDLILYPSTVCKSEYCNMAIHPNFVNNHLRFEKVVKLKIIAGSFGQLSFNMGPVGLIKGNAIKWTGATDKERALFEEFGFCIQGMNGT